MISVRSILFMLAVTIGFVIAEPDYDYPYPERVGVFQCPNNYVFAVTDVQDNAIYMQCLMVPVCDRPPVCSYSYQKCPAASPKTLSFLSGLEEDEEQAPYKKKNCCFFTGLEEEHDLTKCTKLTIKDYLPFEHPPPNPQDLFNDEGIRRTKRQIKLDEPLNRGFAMTFLHKNFNFARYLYVLDINRNSEENGYEIDACSVRCKDRTTTTTRRPTTTKQDFETPESERATRDRVTNPVQQPTKAPKPIEPLNNGNGNPEGDGNRRRIIWCGVRLDDIGGGAVCFDGAALVKTRSGTKAMRDLTVHEEVMVGDGSFEPIEFWYHRQGDSVAQFMSISIRLGEQHRELHISANHLMPIISCAQAAGLRSITKSVFAKRAQAGQCVLLRNPESGELERAEIEHVDVVTSEGVYSPITASGHLLVNDVLASCFSTLENHAVAHTMHQLFIKVHHVTEVVADAVHMVGDMVITGSMQSGPVDGDIPRTMQWLSHLASIVVPNKMY